MIRAFVAIDIPTAQRQRLAALARQLESLGLDGHAVRADSIHLTLKFLGPVDQDRLPAIGEALAEIAADSNRLNLSLRGVGVFPHLERPRVVWLGVDDNQDLTRLQASVETALTPLGFEHENRPFSPHLTLMRLKSGRNGAALVRFLRDHGLKAEAGSFAADEFHLYRSVLKPGGSEYSKLATFPLGVEEAG